MNEEYNFLSEWVTSSKEMSTYWFARRAFVSSEHKETILSSFVLSIANLPGLSNSDLDKICSSGLWISCPMHLYCTEGAVQRPVYAWIKQSRFHIWLAKEGMLFPSWLILSIPCVNFFLIAHVLSIFPCFSFPFILTFFQWSHLTFHFFGFSAFFRCNIPCYTFSNLMCCDG